MTDPSLDSAFASIAERVIPGATLLAHRPLKGGVSAAVHVLEIMSPAGAARVVVRRHGVASWKPLADDVTQAEFQLLAALHGLGLPVPRPLLLDVSARLLPSPFFVMEMVEGSTHIPEDRLDSALRQMADLLAHLHSLDLRSLSLPLLSQREDPIQGALEFLPTDAESAPLRDLISSYELRTPRAALLHGDFWPGNVLWREAQLAALIDWEDAAIGPAASDIACCRAELNVAFGARAAASFTDYYRAASEDDVHDLHLWDVYVGSAALATMHEWGLPPEVEASRRERTSRFVDHAAEALLRTL